jgi:hypothetical protein
VPSETLDRIGHRMRPGPANWTKRRRFAPSPHADQPITAIVGWAKYHVGASQSPERGPDVMRFNIRDIASD